MLRLRDIATMISAIQKNLNSRLDRNIAETYVPTSAASGGPRNQRGSRNASTRVMPRTAKSKMSPGSPSSMATRRMTLCGW